MIQNATIIVPTFNRADYLEECLLALLAQSTPALEIIVVDDGSKDNTADTVRSFGGRVKYIFQENAGKSAALNHALRFAAGENIWAFDDDDIAEADALERLSAALREDPGAMMAYGDFDMFRISNGEKHFSRLNPVIMAPGQEFVALLSQSRFIHQGASLVRRDAFRQVGAFDESLIRSQDYEMVLRLTRNFKCVYVPHVLFHYRFHRNPRGTQRCPIDAEAMGLMWTKFDRQVLTKVYCEAPLCAYVGAPKEELSDRQSFTALLTRCAIVARKGLWNFALKDLERAGRLHSKCGFTELSTCERAQLAIPFETTEFLLDNITAELAHAIAAFGPGTLKTEIRAYVLGWVWQACKRAAKNRTLRTFLRYSKAYVRWSCSF